MPKADRNTRPDGKDLGMTYLAVARLTVGAEVAQQKRELQEGLERVVEEMVGRGMTPTEIEAGFMDACALNEVDL